MSSIGASSYNIHSFLGPLSGDYRGSARTWPEIPAIPVSGADIADAVVGSIVRSVNWIVDVSCSLKHLWESLMLSARSYFGLVTISELNELDQVQLSWLGASVLDRLPDDKLWQLKTRVLNGLSDGQIKRLDARILRQKFIADYQGFGVHILNNLSDDQLKVFYIHGLSYLSNDQIGKLDVSILNRLPDNRINEIGLCTLSRLSAEQIELLDDRILNYKWNDDTAIVDCFGTLNALSNDKLKNIDVSFLNQNYYQFRSVRLKARVLNGLSGYTLGRLEARVLNDIERTESKKLKARVLNGLSDAALNRLEVRALNNLGRAASENLEARVLNGLSGDALDELGSHVLNSLSDAALDGLDARVLNGLSDAALDGLEARVLMGLSDDTFRKLDARALSYLPLELWNEKGVHEGGFLELSEKDAANMAVRLLKRYPHEYLEKRHSEIDLVNDYSDPEDFSDEEDALVDCARNSKHTTKIKETVEQRLERGIACDVYTHFTHTLMTFTYRHGYDQSLYANHLNELMIGAYERSLEYTG